MSPWFLHVGKRSKQIDNTLAGPGIEQKGRSLPPIYIGCDGMIPRYKILVSNHAQGYGSIGPNGFTAGPFEQDVGQVPYDEGVAGSMPPAMDGIPPHWSTVFACDDCDARTAKAVEAGGSVIQEPFDMPIGRLAVLADPQGAVFQMLQMAEPGA